MRRFAAGIAIFACSCSSYGWANRPSETSIGRPVAVRTLDVDAHAGANAATLTREFVAELHRAGVSQAEWTAADRATDVIECRISLVEDQGYADQAFVEVETRCRVDGREAAFSSADAQLAAPSTDRSLGRRRAAENAARDSLGAVARDLAAYLEN